MSMQPVEIARGVYWVGALDPQIRTFDLVMPTGQGTTYNSYLVKGDVGIAVIDTVKEKFQDDFLAKLSRLVRLREIDYIVINHTEPDHSGALPKLLEYTPNARVVISRAARNFLRNLLKREVPTIEVGDGDRIDLDRQELRFISAPFLHWPDTMFTYITQHKLLFPCDFLSCHYCDDRLWDDKVDDFSRAYKYYFDVIMRPFKEHVLKALDKLQGFPIDLIAPSHGPILRTQPQRYIELYRKWSLEPPAQEDSLLILYASAYGNTARMAQAIARGAQEEGARVTLFDLAATDISAVLDKVEAARGLVLGSPTINGDAVKPVWDFIESLVTLKVKGKVGAAFGSYGWSGEGPRLIEERLKGLRLHIPEPALRVAMTPSQEDLAQCQEFGRKVARAILAGESDPAPTS